MAIEITDKWDVTPAEYIDGKWYKNCQCGCNKRFEVPAGLRGTTKYHPGCRAKMRRAVQNKYKGVGGGEQRKRCSLCHEMKPLSLFPLGSRNRIGVCADCSPVDKHYAGSNLPVCGVCDRTDAGWEFTPICVHYDNCMQRGERDLWLPCEVPLTREVIAVIALPDTEYLEAVDLLVPGFNEEGQPEERGLEYYLERL